MELSDAKLIMLTHSIVIERNVGPPAPPRGQYVLVFSLMILVPSTIYPSTLYNLGWKYWETPAPPGGQYVLVLKRIVFMILVPSTISHQLYIIFVENTKTHLLLKEDNKCISVINKSIILLENTEKQHSCPPWTSKIIIKYIRSWDKPFTNREQDRSRRSEDCARKKGKAWLHFTSYVLVESLIRLERSWCVG